MARVNADLLSAYHDRELDAAEAFRIDDLLDDDAEARDLLAAFDRIDAAVRESFDAELDAPVPLALARTVRSGFAERKRRAFGATIVRWAAPMAAAIAIVVLGNHWTGERAAQALAERDAMIAALTDRAIQTALETALSGAQVSVADAKAASEVSITPTRTYKSATQHWCREFEEDVVVEGTHTKRTGIACREENGGWRRVETMTPGNTPPPVGRTL